MSEATCNVGSTDDCARIPPRASPARGFVMQGGTMLVTVLVILAIVALVVFIARR